MVGGEGGVWGGATNLPCTAANFSASASAIFCAFCVIFCAIFCAFCTANLARQAPWPEAGRTYHLGHLGAAPGSPWRC